MYLEEGGGGGVSLSTLVSPECFVMLLYQVASVCHAIE